MENIKEGRVQMQVIDDPSPRPMERLYDITFDKTRIRQIRRIRLRGKSEWGGAERVIVTPTLSITDHEDLKFPPPVQIDSTINYKLPREQLRVLNVQAVGMDINGADMLHSAHVESLLNRTDRRDLVVKADQRGGLDTWRIDYDLKQRNPPVHTSVWIAPTQGFSIVGIEMKIDEGGRQRMWVTDSQLKRYPAGDIWYPTKVVKTVKVGDQIVEHQVISIKDARFGGPVDEMAFTSSGLDLKPGRQIIDSSSGQPWGKVWDGDKMVDPSGVQSAHPPSPAFRRSLLLWITATGLALLAIAYFWHVLRYRRPAPPPTGA
jgi:hypothetical protein